LAAASAARLGGALHEQRALLEHQLHVDAGRDLDLAAWCQVAYGSLHASTA
jgi:hypothetical protein